MFCKVQIDQCVFPARMPGGIGRSTRNSPRRSRTRCDSASSSHWSADGDASPSQLSHALDEPLGNVAYHVRILHRLGLVESSARARSVRPSNITTAPWCIPGSAPSSGRGYRPRSAA